VLVKKRFALDWWALMLGQNRCGKLSSFFHVFEGED